MTNPSSHPFATLRTSHEVTDILERSATFSDTVVTVRARSRP